MSKFKSFALLSFSLLCWTQKAMYILTQHFMACTACRGRSLICCVPSAINATRQSSLKPEIHIMIGAVTPKGATVQLSSHQHPMKMVQAQLILQPRRAQRAHLEKAEKGEKAAKAAKAALLQAQRLLQVQRAAGVP